MHPSCPIKQNTWESPKYKHCLLLKQFIVSDLENVTWINQTRVFLPGRRAALVPPRCPAAATAGHDPESAVASSVPSPVPRSPDTHRRDGRSCGSKRAWDSQFLNKMLHLEGQLLHWGKAVQLCLLFAVREAQKIPFGGCSGTPTVEAVLPFWSDFGTSWVESLAWRCDNRGVSAAGEFGMRSLRCALTSTDWGCAAAPHPLTKSEHRLSDKDTFLKIHFLLGN